jgi:hypothetical protein
MTREQTFAEFVAWVDRNVKYGLRPLNLEVAKRIDGGMPPVTAPGIPGNYSKLKRIVTTDCIGV